MPYESIQALPAPLRHTLPLAAQRIYWQAFNDAWGEYTDTLGSASPAALEEAVSRSAWAAVRRQYRRDMGTGRWRLIQPLSSRA